MVDAKRLRQSISTQGKWAKEDVGVCSARDLDPDSTSYRA
jgi:hypothetical protein